MKIRFYTIKDLYEEVKDKQRKVVRMQFLESKYSQEYRGDKQRSYLPMTEQILTLTVLVLPQSYPRDSRLYYYSQPFARCITYELKDKATEIDEKQKALEAKVRETFKGWTVKKGVYEIE